MEKSPGWRGSKNSAGKNSSEFALRTVERVGAYGWQSSVAEPESVYGRVVKAYAAREKAILDPTKLIVVDEADRLQMASLEQLRAIFDESDLGLILIGMPGLEKRLARYPQFYSRIGFVHEFRPLGAGEIRQLLEQGWVPSGNPGDRRGLSLSPTRGQRQTPDIPLP